METVTRRNALRALGVGAGAFTLLPFLSDDGLLAFADLQHPEATPKLRALTPEQYATTEHLVEAILPADERSPGAKETPGCRLPRPAAERGGALQSAEEWIEGLRGLDAEATARFGAPFLRIEATQVEALLTDISRFEAAPPPAGPTGSDATRGTPVFVENLMGGVSVASNASRRKPLEAFFAITKHATLHGYYTSEIGIHRSYGTRATSSFRSSWAAETEDGQDCPHCGQNARLDMAADPTLDVNLTRAPDESKRLADSIKPGSDRWDVIVVGSGAAGGMAAFQLAMAGVKVLLLEAGRMIDVRREYRTMEWPYASMRRGRLPPANGRSTSPSTTFSIARTDRTLVRKPQKGRSYAANRFTRNWVVDERQHPTTGTPYAWVRANVLGGKTNFWGRGALRYGPLQFNAASRDGFDVDWPISLRRCEAVLRQG